MLKNYFIRMKSKSESPSRKPLNKIIWSGISSFLGIYIISEFGKYFAIDSFFLLGSFGASAVLIYGAPQADYSQPRNIVCGHVVSAFVSVFIVKYFAAYLSFEFLCALAVSSAIVCMHFTKTIHPPGGATALIYVIGNEKIKLLGWLYPITPIGVGAIIMLVVAIAINNLSSNDKRHYPLYWW